MNTEHDGGPRPRLARLTRRQLALSAAAALAAGAGPAPAARELFKPVTGLWLLPSNHSAMSYGPTDPGATWTVAQWDIPADLPPFHNNVSENEYARVALLGPGVYELEQHCGNLPCERLFPSGRKLVDEFDLFIAPNGPTTPHAPPAATGVFPALSQISHLRHAIRLEPLELQFTDAACRISQIGLTTAISLGNNIAKQVLFYQLHLSVIRQQDGVMRQIPAPPGWFFQGENLQSGGHGQFGFSDNITHFGVPAATPGREYAYDVDLRARLDEVIAMGAAHGIDQNRAHWVPRNNYHGSGAFGHVEIRSRWSGFSLNVA